MKKTIRIFTAVLTVIFTAACFSGCEKKEKFVPQSAYEAYVMAYNNSTGQDKFTAESDGVFTITAEGQDEDSYTFKSIFKRDYNSEDDYKISMSKTYEYSDEEIKYNAYASEGFVYIDENNEKRKQEMSCDDVMEIFFRDWLKPVEETVSESDFAENDDGGYDINIKIDPDKFVEFMDNDEYSYFCEAFNLYEKKYSVDISEISFKAATDSDINLISEEISLTAEVDPQLFDGKNVSIKINVKNGFSGFGDTKAEEATNLDEYVIDDGTEEKDNSSDNADNVNDAEISSEELARQ